jgi:hypothetical protein
VAFSLADARDQILARAASAVPATVVPATALTVPVTAATMAAATSG